MHSISVAVFDRAIRADRCLSVRCESDRLCPIISRIRACTDLAAVGVLRYRSRCPRAWHARVLPDSANPRLQRREGRAHRTALAVASTAAAMPPVAASGQADGAS
jgi:hypothetical protein